MTGDGQIDLALFEHLADRGRQHAAGGAFEQPAVEGALNLAEHSRGRGLGHVHGVGGLVQIALAVLGVTFWP